MKINLNKSSQFDRVREFINILTDKFMLVNGIKEKWMDMGSFTGRKIN